MPRRRRATKRPAVSVEPEPTAAITAVEELPPQDEECWALEMPWEVWVAVLDFLSCGDVARFAVTCQFFNAVADMGIVWRERIRRECKSAVERWGWDLMDGPQVGWKAVFLTYKRLSWARLNVSYCCANPFRMVPKYFDRDMFEVDKNFQCLAVDEDSFTPKPDTVALGIFGSSLRSDCIQLWRKATATSAPKLRRAVADRVVSDAGQTWRMASGLKGHNSTVSCLKFVGGAERLISGSWDSTIKVWHNLAVEGKQPSCLTTLSGHTFEVNCIARHQSLLASGSQDKTVALWDLDAGKRVHSFEGHTHIVDCVVFNKEGNLIFSGSADKTIRMWDTRAGAKHVKSYNGENPVQALAINPDGTRLYYGPFSISGFGYWFDMATDRRVGSICMSSYYRNDTSRLAILPFRLDKHYDYLLCSGSLVRLPLASTYEDIGVHKLSLGSGSGHYFDASKGMCWTNSQVIVTGGRKKVYFADMATKGLAPDPEEVERAKQQCRERLLEISAEHRAKENQIVHLPRQPTADEVAKDIARIQMQIAKIQQARRKRAT